MALAVLRLEFIGENVAAYQREVRKGMERHPQLDRYSECLGRDKSKPWVARLSGLNEQFGYQRAFMRGQIDYSHANSVGSRGVWLHYALPIGIYEVNARESWKHVRRYFISVEDVQDEAPLIREVAREWVDQQFTEGEPNGRL